MGATRRARWAFLMLALAQHAMAVAAVAVGFDVLPTLAFYTVAQLPALAWLLLGRLPAPGVDRSLTHLGRVLVFSLGGATFQAVGLGTQRPDVRWLLLVGPVAGVALGAAFHPLFALADEWRRRGTLADALNAWSALAIYPLVVGALLRACLPDWHVEFVRAADGLCLVGALVAAAVLAVELHWRRHIGRALAGTLPGLRPVDETDHDDGPVPDWSLTAAMGRRLLITDAPVESYRAGGQTRLVAVLPTEVRTSWRLWWMPGVVLAGVARCW